MSTIPLISLFVVTVSFMILLINCLRLSIANHILNGELVVDKEFIRKYTMMQDYKVNEQNISIRNSNSDNSHNYPEI